MPGISVGPRKGQLLETWDCGLHREGIGGGTGMEDMSCGCGRL